MFMFFLLIQTAELFWLKFVQVLLVSSAMSSGPSIHASSDHVQWSFEEEAACRSLMGKAYEVGRLDELVADVKSAHSWDAIEDLPQNSNSYAGAMKDASKKLCESEPLPSNLGSMIPGPASTTVTVEAPGQLPMNLPPGVASLSQWGKCLIAFGKFKRRATYESLAMNEGQGQYKTWLANHYRNGSPEHRDLVHYLHCTNDPHIMKATIQTTMSQAVIVPGSKVERIFAV